MRNLFVNSLHLPAEEVQQREEVKYKYKGNGYETWSLIHMEEYKLRGFHNCDIRRIFQPERQRQKVIGRGITAQ
jgi:hypothetical protein